MTITVRYNNKEKIINDGFCEDVLEELEEINALGLDEYEILVEDIDESALQIMNGGLFVGIPTENHEIYCRYTSDVIGIDLLEEAIEDFFDGDTEFQYINWDHDLDDYIPI